MTDEEREDLNTFKHDLVKQARWWQWKAETLEKENERLKAENAELRKLLKNERHEAKKRKMALELACLDMIKEGLRWMEDWQGKIAAYMKRAEEYIDNGNEYRLTFMFRDVRVTEQKGSSDEKH